MAKYKGKRLEWSQEKNKILIKSRFISFDIIEKYIAQELFVDVIDHPNLDKYPNQRMFVLKIESYIFLVPFVQDGEKIFLKTIIPSRKFTKQLIKNKK